MTSFKLLAYVVKASESENKNADRIFVMLVNRLRTLLERC